MEIKLFGKSIFEFNKNSSYFYINQADERNNKSKYLPDFYINTTSGTAIESSVMSIPVSEATDKLTGVEKKEDKEKVHITPRDIYELKMLNEKSLTINTDSDYVEEQIKSFKDKLSFVKKEEFDMSRGLSEISSVLMRLENRKKYPKFKDFFEQYPYTTTSKIKDIIEKNDYLKIGQVSQFVADMPAEAIEEMKKYKESTEKLCSKEPVFYIIANKKDFQKTETRKDPILLAQSPFGHFWQIIGCWDKEMLLLEEL